jgi:hypothetical protein
MKISRRKFLKSIPALFTGVVVAAQLPGQSPEEKYGPGPVQNIWNRWGESFLEEQRWLQNPWFADCDLPLPEIKFPEIEWKPPPSTPLPQNPFFRLQEQALKKGRRISRLFGKRVVVFSDDGSKYEGVLAEVSRDLNHKGDICYIVDVSERKGFAFSESFVSYVYSNYIFLKG